MDYTNITLGTLLSHPNETIRRNAISILKILQRKKQHDPRTCENSVPCYDCEHPIR